MSSPETDRATGHHDPPPGLPSPRAPFPAIWQGAVLVLILTLLLLLCGGFADWAVRALGREAGPLATLAIGNSLAFAVLLPFAVLFTRRPLRETFPFRPIRPGQWLPMGLVVIGWQVVASDLDNLLRSAWPPPAWLEELFLELFTGGENLPLQFLVLVVIAPVTEELFFRGVLLQGFLKRYRFRTAAIASAALFALFHANPWQLVSPFVIGILFAWWCSRIGSLWPGVFGHALNNGTPLITALLGVEIRGYTSPLEEIAFQPLWFDVLGLGMMGAGLWFLVRVLPGSPPPGGGSRKNPLRPRS